MQTWSYLHFLDSRHRWIFCNIPLNYHNTSVPNMPCMVPIRRPVSKPIDLSERIELSINIVYRINLIMISSYIYAHCSAGQRLPDRVAINWCTSTTCLCIFVTPIKYYCSWWAFICKFGRRHLSASICIQNIINTAVLLWHETICRNFGKHSFNDIIVFLFLWFEFICLSVNRNV